MSLSGVVATGSTFLFQIVLTHLLSLHENGIMSRWLTDIGYLSVVFVLGLDNALLYYSRIEGAIASNMGKNLVVSSIMLAIALFLIAILPVDKLHYTSLIIVITMIAMSSANAAYFQICENFPLFNTITILRPLALLLGFSVCLLQGIKVNVKIAILLYVGTVVVATATTMTLNAIYGHISFKRLNLFDWHYYSYGIKSILNTVLSLSLYASAIYMLTYLSGYEAVAQFFVASSISKMVWVLPDAAGNLLYPRFLKATSDYDLAVAEDLMSRFGQIVFGVTIISLIGFGLLGKTFLSLVYSSSYGAVFGPTLVLLFGNYGMVYYKLISRLLASRNNWKPLYLALTTVIAVNIILHLILVPAWGVMGSAFACAASFWACGLVLTPYVRGSLLSFLDLRKLLRT